jgi:hypothetical protein
VGAAGKLNTEQLGQVSGDKASYKRFRHDEVFINKYERAVTQKTLKAYGTAFAKFSCTLAKIVNVADKCVRMFIDHVDRFFFNRERRSNKEHGQINTYRMIFIDHSSKHFLIINTAR